MAKKIFYIIAVLLFSVTFTSCSTTDDDASEIENTLNESKIVGCYCKEGTHSERIDDFNYFVYYTHIINIYSNHAFEIIENIPNGYINNESCFSSYSVNEGVWEYNNGTKAILFKYVDEENNVISFKGYFSSNLRFITTDYYDYKNWFGANNPDIPYTKIK